MFKFNCWMVGGVSRRCPATRVPWEFLLVWFPLTFILYLLLLLLCLSVCLSVPDIYKKRSYINIFNILILSPLPPYEGY